MGPARGIIRPMKVRSSSSALDPGRDEALVRRCLEGDQRAWNDLVRRYERLVYSIGLSYRLSEEDLGDVFQEVFAALVRGLPRLRDARAICRWISSTTDRTARAAAFKIRREWALRAGDDEIVLRIPADLAAAGVGLEVLEEQALVRLGLAALPPRCRRLIEALYYEDPVPSYAALSRRFSLPVGSLGPTRARCMDRLRKLLLEQQALGERISDAGSATSVAKEPGRRLRAGAWPNS